MAKRYTYNTSATQVKKRYAMIGNTATQVKKRYAMIGGTATLVYSAESQFYPGVTPTQLKSVNGGDFTATSADWNVSLPNGINLNSKVCYIPIDLTNISKLTINGTGGHGAGYYLVTEAQKNLYGVDDGYLSYPYYIWVADYNYIYVKKGTSFPVTIDTSSYTGTYYLFLGAYTNNGGTRSASITSVIGE